MKKFFLIAGGIFFFFTHCAQTESNEASKNPAAGESRNEGLDDFSKIQMIDEYIASFKKAETRIMGQKYYINFYSTKDKAYVKTKDGVKVGLVVDTYPPDGENRYFYYLKDGKLVSYTHREWIKTGNPHAKEINCYMDDRGIFKLQERYIQLEPDQNPSPLLSLPYVDSPLNRDSLLSVIKTEQARVEKAAVKN